MNPSAVELEAFRKMVRGVPTITHPVEVELAEGGRAEIRYWPANRSTHDGELTYAWEQIPASLQAQLQESLSSEAAFDLVERYLSREKP